MRSHRINNNFTPEEVLTSNNLSKRSFQEKTWILKGVQQFQTIDKIQASSPTQPPSSKDTSKIKLYINMTKNITYMLSLHN